MEFQAVLGILAVLGFGYFLYRKVTAKKSQGNGGGGTPDRNNDNRSER